VNTSQSRKTGARCPPSIDDTVFGEPSGRPLAPVHLSGALVLSSVDGYYTVVDGATRFGVVPLPVAGKALPGVAESLPKPRCRAAGVLRFTALLVVVGLLTVVASTPDLL